MEGDLDCDGTGINEIHNVVHPHHCHAKCSEDKRCKSVSWHPGKNICMLKDFVCSYRDGIAKNTGYWFYSRKMGKQHIFIIFCYHSKVRLKRALYTVRKKEVKKNANFFKKKK